MKKIKKIWKKAKKYFSSKFKTSLVIVGLLFAIAIVYEGCREIRDLLSPRTPSERDSLRDGEREKIIIDSNGDVRKIRRGRDGRTQTERTSTGAEKVELVIKDDGTVEYREKTFGFLFEPGISTSMDKDAVLLGADVRFAYWRNLGLLGGVAVSLRENKQDVPKFRVYGGIGYRLPFQKFRNTSVFLGYNINDSYQVGVRTKF